MFQIGDRRMLISYLGLLSDLLGKAVRRGPGTPDVIISDKAAKKNDGHPDQERQYREPLDGRTTADRIFPVLFVLSERDLEDGGDKRSDAHEEHLHPKRNRQ